MDAQKAFLSWVIKKQDAQEALQQNLSSEMFHDDAKKIWQWLVSFYREFGYSPGEEAFDAAFPLYSLTNARESLQYWAEEVRKNYLRSVITDYSQAASAHLKGGNPRLAIEQLRKAVAIADTTAAKHMVQDWQLTAPQRIERYEAAKLSGGIEGYPYPFPALTKITGGIQKGDFVVIVAPTGIGKTWFLTLLACEAMKAGRSTFFAEKEMEASQILRRLDALFFGLPYSELRFGRLDYTTETSWKQSMEGLHERPELGRFVVDDDPFGGPSALHAKIDQLKPELCIVDGFYLMQDDGGLKSGWEMVQSVSRDLKRVAKGTHCPVIATAQLNDEGQVAFFKGIRRDVDVMLRLEQTTDQRVAKRMTIYIDKQREGERFAMEVKWDLNEMDFSEIEARPMDF